MLFGRNKEIKKKARDQKHFQKVFTQNLERSCRWSSDVGIQTSQFNIGCWSALCPAPRSSSAGLAQSTGHSRNAPLGTSSASQRWPHCRGKHRPCRTPRTVQAIVPASAPADTRWGHPWRPPARKWSDGSGSAIGTRTQQSRGSSVPLAGRPTNAQVQWPDSARRGPGGWWSAPIRSPGCRAGFATRSRARWSLAAWIAVREWSGECLEHKVGSAHSLRTSTINFDFLLSPSACRTVTYRHAGPTPQKFRNVGTRRRSSAHTAKTKETWKCISPTSAFKSEVFDAPDRWKSESCVCQWSRCPCSAKRSSAIIFHFQFSFFSLSLSLLASFSPLPPSPSLSPRFPKSLQFGSTKLGSSATKRCWHATR